MIAFTCTPVERPCVASNWLVMNWNSAIESWLKRGWLPAPSSEPICWPSRLSWNSRCSPPLRSGSGAVALVDEVRLPGASSASAIQLRPCAGSSDICFGSMLPPSLDVVVSMSGASPVTVTVSCSVEGAICRLIVAVWPTRRLTPWRFTVLKPVSEAVIRYVPTRAGMR